MSSSVPCETRTFLFLLPDSGVCLGFMDLPGYIALEVGRALAVTPRLPSKDLKRACLSIPFREERNGSSSTVKAVTASYIVLSKCIPWALTDRRTLISVLRSPRGPEDGPALGSTGCSDDDPAKLFAVTSTKGDSSAGADDLCLTRKARGDARSRGVDAKMGKRAMERIADRMSVRGTIVQVGFRPVCKLVSTLKSPQVSIPACAETGEGRRRER